ncbi:MAG: formate/nitrite transporter family protein [Mycoplasmoidaceae bacterium]
MQKEINIEDIKNSLPKNLAEIINFGYKKSKYSLLKKIIFGIMGGVFIGFAYIAYLQFVGMQGDDATSKIFAKLLGVLIFPIGIILVIFMGGNLFTSNCLISAISRYKIIDIKEYLKDLLIVFLSNFLGAILFGILCGLVGIFEPAFIKALVATSIHKLKSEHYSIFYNTLFSAVFCNFLVAGSIYVYVIVKEKGIALFIVFLMLVVFALFGFQHIVANMVLFSADVVVYIINKKEFISYLSIDPSFHGAGDLFFREFVINFPLTTIGNIIGGTLVTEIYFLSELSVQKIKNRK